MAKDDYPKIVCKILVFLYKKLKKKTDKEINEYIIAESPDFPIGHEYLEYVLIHLIEDGFVENVKTTNAWGGDELILNYDKMRISPKGIYYLKEKSIMKMKERDYYNCPLMDNEKIEEYVCFEIHTVVNETSPKSIAPTKIFEKLNYKNICTNCKYHRFDC